jgi:Alpha/beta hydrolase domain
MPATRTVVPDARYVARISEGNPLRAGMKRFSEPQMKELYGNREAYLDKVGVKLDEMIEQGLLLPEDKELMLGSLA